MKLLLVEDEEVLSSILAKGLKKTGFAVDQAYDGEQALYLYEVNDYDLIILDLNLPVIDGIEVLTRIRQTNFRIKILILSARNEVPDRISGLNQGANDYLVKPFDFEELVARVNNLTRQSFVQTPPRLCVGSVSIDLLSKTATAAHAPLALTRKEYGILEYLMLNRGRVIGQSELIEHVWESETDLFSNSLKFHLHSLRKKLGKDDPITNIRGKGYIIPGDDAHE